MPIFINNASIAFHYARYFAQWKYSYQIKMLAESCMQSYHFVITVQQIPMYINYIFLPMTFTLEVFKQIYFDKLELSNSKLKKEYLQIQILWFPSIYWYIKIFFLSYIHCICNIGSFSSMVIYSFFPLRWIIFQAELDVF